MSNNVYSLFSSYLKVKTRLIGKMDFLSCNIVSSRSINKCTSMALNDTSKLKTFVETGMEG